MHVDATCHCGQVSYRAEVHPERVSLCYCTDCQTRSRRALPARFATDHAMVVA